MSKLKRKPPPRAEGIAPTPERFARGPIERPAQAIADEAGRPARPYRAVDTLAMMARKGSITAQMRQAGADFHARFVTAALDPLGAPDLMRVRVPHGMRELSLTERQAEARKHVWRALEAMGGIAAPAGACLWHVVGCEWTVKDWALREGWGGRPLSQETAAGILIGALGVLQRLYGL